MSSYEREPSYQDWINAVPAERREQFARHFEIGRARMQGAFESGSNLHGAMGCPCMRHTEPRPTPRAERMWQDGGE